MPASLQALQQLGLTQQQRQRIARGCKVFRQLLTPMLQERQQLQGQQQQQLQQQQQQQQQEDIAGPSTACQFASYHVSQGQQPAAAAAVSYNPWAVAYCTPPTAALGQQCTAAGAAPAGAAAAATAAAARALHPVAGYTSSATGAAAAAAVAAADSSSSSGGALLGSWQTEEKVLGKNMEEQQRVARLRLLMQKVVSVYHECIRMRVFTRRDQATVDWRK
jgi:hypothetical protein